MANPCQVTCLCPCFKNVAFNPKSATYNLQQTTISNLADFFFKTNNIKHFHENCLLADNPHDISRLIFSKISKDVATFVVCCSRDWRLKGFFLFEPKIS